MTQHPLYDLILRDLRIDIGQMREEGHDPAALAAEVDAAVATGSLEALAQLQGELWHRPSPPSFPYVEPNDWEALARGFPDPATHARFAGSEAILADRLLAAWQGRCIGCVMGKPLEGAWPEEVRQTLMACESWPLLDYLKPVTDAKRLAELRQIDGYGKRLAWAQPLTRGSFSTVVPDDDIHYAIVGQLVLEEHGVQFTAAQAAAKLVAINPRQDLWCAGLNLFRTSLFGYAAPYTALCGNPSRQSLGAQIRCDPFGWAAPGNPALAARLAYEDARNSQVRNGVYSGIFFAVAMADALAHGDPVRALATATQYVPPRSRFAEMLAFTRAACDRHADWEAANAAIYARYDQDLDAPERCPMNHSLINAAITVMAILKGGGDFARTVGISVMAGRDTDCNGATAGSIMGCALGTAGVPAHLVAPFHDTVTTHLCGMPELRISDLARRMFAVARRATG